MILTADLNEIGIKITDIERIHQVFQLFPEIEKVVLFGSRAIGNYKPLLDLDLTLIGKELNLTIQQKLETELDNFLLPFTFYISIYDQIKNVEFLDHINRIGKDFYINK